MDNAEKQELLKQEILGDAEKRATTIAKRAKRDAKKTQDEAEKKAADFRDHLLSNAEKEASHEASRVLAGVPMEKARRKLTLQDEAIHAVMGRAVERLNELEGNERVAMLAGLLADAVRSIGEDQVVVRTSDPDRAIFDGVCAEAQSLLADADQSIEFRLDTDGHAISGGIAAQSADGHKLVDHSFDARLRRLEPELRSHLAEVLFGE